MGAGTTPEPAGDPDRGQAAELAREQDRLTEIGYASLPIGLVTAIHDAMCEQREPHGQCDIPDVGHTAYDAAVAVLISRWFGDERAEVWEEAVEATVDWVAAIGHPGPNGPSDPPRNPYIS